MTYKHCIVCEDITEVFNGVGVWPIGIDDVGVR